ncbi:MAG: hypothetical protein KDI71_01785 [Xanthomonadales bacterium]|nr:hypothetical protein [Xanthomonadales bacterium]
MVVNDAQSLSVQAACVINAHATAAGAQGLIVMHNYVGQAQIHGMADSKTGAIVLARAGRQVTAADAEPFDGNLDGHPRAREIHDSIEPLGVNSRCGRAGTAQAQRAANVQITLSTKVFRLAADGKTVDTGRKDDRVGSRIAIGLLNRRAQRAGACGAQTKTVREAEICTVGKAVDDEHGRDRRLGCEER